MTLSRLTSSTLAPLLSGLLLLSAADRDPKAEQLARQMQQAMGGEAAWNAARFVRYDFIVNDGGKQVARRAHLWDKQAGRYRLEDKTKDGQNRVTLLRLADQHGSVWVNGKKLEEAAAAEPVKAAYGAFINDMYWLSMPWKWFDQGVHLKYAGPQTLRGKKYEVVELNFDRVGLTPGDRYRAFLSPQSHLMEHWEYTLQSGNKGSWDWQYVTTGGVKLAQNHTNAEGKSISMGDVRVLDKVDDAYLTNPDRGLNTLK